MFYEWVYPLHTLDGLSALNVFRYITFRAAYAAITALLVCFVLGPPMIEWLRRVGLGQEAVLSLNSGCRPWHCTNYRYIAGRIQVGCLPAS